MCSFRALRFLSVVCCVAAAAADDGSATVVVDLSAPTTLFDHYWEKCMGSGHASLTLRADWRKHVLMARDKLGIERVRFHGILDDDFSTSLGPGLNSYVNVDSWADFMVEHNMSAIVELGFMPRWLARGKIGEGKFACNHTINHYQGCSDPPSDFAAWGEVGKRVEVWRGLLPLFHGVQRCSCST